MIQLKRRPGTLLATAGAIGLLALVVAGSAQAGPADPAGAESPAVHVAPPPAAEAVTAGSDAAASTPTTTPIKHFLFLMQENHTLRQLLRDLPRRRRLSARHLRPRSAPTSRREAASSRSGIGGSHDR